KQPEEGRLSRAVRSEEDDDLARVERQVDARQDGRPGEGPDEALGADRRARHYRTVDPGATAVSGATRTTRSPSAAASTMPWLSTPRSFAGSRFATTTTWRPTSAGGS